MTSDNWYCRFGDKDEGPYTLDELAYLARRGQIAPATQLRQGKEGHWIAAGRLLTVFPNTPSTPPTPDRSSLPSEQNEPPIETESFAPFPDAFPAIPEDSEDAEDATTLQPLPSEDRAPIHQPIVLGSIALLLILLLLLALLTMPGDGGDDIAEGNGGPDAGSGPAASASNDPGGGSDSNPTGNANTSETRQGTSAKTSRPEEKTGKNPGPTPRATASSSSSNERKETSAEPTKPIPTATSAIAYDIAERDAKTKKAAASGAGLGGDLKGGSGKEGDFFGIKAEGRRFIYIVDCSSSMHGGSFQRVCEELVRSISNLTSKQSFYVFFFNHRSIPMFEDSKNMKMLSATPPNIKRVREWIASMRASGSTDPSVALSEAIKMKPDAIFLLSDGQIPGDIPGGLRIANVPPKVSKRKVLVPINTIGFQYTGGELLLKQIAAENDGEYRFIPGNNSANPMHGMPSNFPGHGPHRFGRNAFGPNAAGPDATGPKSNKSKPDKSKPDKSKPRSPDLRLLPPSTPTTPSTSP